MDIKFFEVLEDGTLNEESDFSQKSSKVLIIVDDQFKRIFLWKGANSGIKKKFIGSRAAAELRKTYYGFAYRLSVIEEGDETQEFEFTIKRSKGEATVGVIEETTRGIPTNPSVLGLETGVDIKISGDEPSKKIIYTDRDKAEITQFAGARSDSTPEPSIVDGPRPKRPEPVESKTNAPQPQRTILSEMMGGKEPTIIRPAPGTDTAKRYGTPSPSVSTPPPPPPSTTSPPPTPPPTPQQQRVIPKSDPKEAFALIKELGVPVGYERDLIIVGTGVYKQQGNDFLVPPNPPEGVFLAPDRVPRIIIENGVVKVIEILKKIQKEAKEKDEVKFDQDIEDLMSTFQIEIE
ncbi:MAG: hypothetical protein JXA54_08670 [Candidatus Heimdallarchaeota archaeon]|nr:hypothetical protein [Candidatus Heimdallarchaeota archaeon]